MSLTRYPERDDEHGEGWVSYRLATPAELHTLSAEIDGDPAFVAEGDPLAASVEYPVVLWARGSNEKALKAALKKHKPSDQAELRAVLAKALAGKAMTNDEIHQVLASLVRRVFGQVS